MPDIQDILDQITECPGNAGAVLATADGLLMASSGALHGDVAAATAASLVLAGKEALSALGKRPWVEQLIWYQTQLHGTHVLLLVCDDHGHAGALRWTARRMVQQLEPSLLQL
ncbi:MAG: hypothetical protein A2W72_04310 [Burkholderiales bacterium RIFCSPLOWO2_12_67_14]|nr:MAG: hypothetical protein A3I64_04530 [Burkholderiales bacterium RIFCSPLOWO2_02_FULL_67_64]OGB38478.1 MAG: hypothetical protein A3E51_02545 [Burkholderiales bacterium RIFCSPHIGHO2_12_FULL_67_38]OGB47500.1 MAG: hypothetical protein A2W72_04310 [Burkholderiales bacterium RIFCSPLOWO2_12_67_14]